MPVAMNVPPAGPSSARIVSDAGAALAASPAAPSVVTYAKFASRYVATTMPTPSSSARGRLRCGSRISPATKFAFCQPPNAKSTGISAAPSATATAGDPAAPRRPPLRLHPPP